MKSVFRVFLLISFLVVSGCNSLSNTSETKNDSRTLCKDIGNWKWVSNDLKDNPQGFASITWKEYSKIYTLPANRISKITIEYTHGTLYDQVARCVVIKSSWGSYITNDGIILNSRKIQNLADAFTNLRLSSGVKVCEGSEYKYAAVDMEIEYSNGEKAILYTSSNCTEGLSPWNIIYGGNSYFQATGEIPNALYEIIASFDADIGDWWKPGSFITADSFRRKSFPLKSYARSADSPFFSDNTIFREHLSQDQAFVPYLETFEIQSISLACPVGTNCSEVESKVSLISKEHIVISLNVLFSGNDIVVSSPLSANEWVDISGKLLSHPFIQLARSAKNDSTFKVDCWMESECADKDWCADAHALLGQAVPAVELVCSVEFHTEYPNKAIFFPGEGFFWVKEFSHVPVFPLAKDGIETQVMSWPPDMEILTNLFRTAGFPSFVDEHGSMISIDADIGQCNSIGLGFDYVTVHTSRLFARELQAQSPPHIWVIRSFSSINQIDINGYCVFISPDGEFVLYQP